MKYIVEITETLQKTLIVEIDERDESAIYDAINEAYRSEADEMFVLNADDWVGTEFDIKPADEDSAVDVSL